MPKTVIVLTGPMASGKGNLKKWARARGIPYVEMSELVEERTARSKEEAGREGMQDLANEQRGKQGPDLFARETAREIDRADSELVIVDGMRNVHECEYFRQRYRTLVVGIVPPSLDLWWSPLSRQPGAP